MTPETIDLRFQGKPHVIAAFLLRGPEGPVLIETGPSSTLPRLLSELDRLGVDPAEVRDVLVTHIHLDHAGAAGWWARRGARVHVHPEGAPHLIDPSKLVASATRIYGERMDTLWGEIPAAPAENVVVIRDGEILEVGGLRIEVIESPGHARHHHVYRLGDVAFTGDAAGIRLPEVDWIDLPAPPPEFDLEAWHETIARLRGLKLRRLYRTHFDASPGDADAELARFDDLITRGADLVRRTIDEGLERPAMVARFSAEMRALAGDVGLDAAMLEAYELANPRVMSVDGIARYWKRRA
jgi:glyoxylase-like metal-dependent hydrolase (beta-lactamase superfamily II)